MNDKTHCLDSTPAVSPMFPRVISAICQGHDQIRFLHLKPGEAAMELGDAATLVLFTWDEARSDELARHLRELMKKRRAKGVLVVGLLGGDDRAWQVLRKAKPMLTRVKVGQVHIAGDGRVRSRDADPVKQALADLERTPPPSEQEWALILAKSAADVADFAGEMKSATEFVALLRARRPVATWTLAGVILAVFGLELAFGGTQSPPVLLRMGALSPERVLAGEVWRLFSCTFLHSGPMHLLFNTYVLWVLGTSLERVLGSWRFLILYGLSCLGGSLASLAFLEGFSVGASGGLWGLLGAEAVLAWRSRGLLPDAMIPAARRVTAINLGINLLNSFRPHVDMWAHFGGGAVGAALLLSGALTRSLPRLGELTEAGRLGHPGEAAIPGGTLVRAAASTVAAVLLLGLVLGLGTGQAWTLRRPLEHERTHLPTLGISLLLAKGLEQTPGPPEEGASVNVGDLLTDPGAVIVAAYPGDLTGEAVLAREHAALVEALEKAPPGSRLAAGPEDVSILGMRGLTVNYTFENGIEEELAFVFLTNALVKVDALRWPAFGDAVPEGYAARLLESLLPLYTDAIDTLRREAAQGNTVAHNDLAWLLATCPDSAYHDGQEAVDHALAAVAQAPDDAGYVDTLAAAYARAGDFQKAVQTQERVLALLSEESGLQRFEDRLALYRSGEAYTDE